MPKALLISTVSRQFTLFDRDNIQILRELGYEVHCAANFEDATPALDTLDIIRHHIDIQRSPFSIRNAIAFLQLLKLMKSEKFDLVHCHAPMGGVLGRLCAQLARVRPVLYTAHGFHFYKGAPFINNLIYKNIERLAAHWTDGLLTMNEEDYNAAQHFHLKKGGNVHYIPGVGVDTKAIGNVRIERAEKRKELGISDNAFLILSIGELIERKNHRQAIESIARLKNEGYNNIYYAICGRGVLNEKLQSLCIELGVSENVLFLGYRSDIAEILKVSDTFVFTSFQEGLPKSAMEAMAAGLPIIATKVRGNTDLIFNNVNGLIVEIGDLEGTAHAIKRLYQNEDIRRSMSTKNLERIKLFDISNVNSIMKDIYSGVTELG